jgi:hypothetical protein
MQQTSSARKQSAGISWLKLVLALILAWWTVRLGFGITRWCFIDWVNLPFHEAGHVFFRPFGETVHYLGGTIFQLLVPSLLVWYFLKRVPNRLAAAFCTWWLGESLINVSIYMADARDLKLPLVGGGHHDWNHLFYTFGLLDQGSVAAISGTTHLFAVLVMLLGLAWCFFFALPEARQNRIRIAVASNVPGIEPLLNK